FQTTIVAGLLISPFIYSDYRKVIPKKALVASSIMLIGVLLSQLAEANNTPLGNILLGAFLIIVAASLFPLGNRKIMLYQEKENIKLNAIQKVAGMTIGSIPLWIIVAFIAYQRSGAP